MFTRNHHLPSFQPPQGWDQLLQVHPNSVVWAEKCPLRPNGGHRCGSTHGPKINPPTTEQVTQTWQTHTEQFNASKGFWKEKSGTKKNRSLVLIGRNHSLFWGQGLKIVNRLLRRGTSKDMLYRLRSKT